MNRMVVALVAAICLAGVPAQVVGDVQTNTQEWTGDLDGNGYVGSGDLDLVRGNWSESVVPTTLGDANGDGFVSSADLDTVRGNWGNVVCAAPQALIPEPTSLIIWALGLLCLSVRRRWG